MPKTIKNYVTGLIVNDEFIPVDPLTATPIFDANSKRKRPRKHTNMNETEFEGKFLHEIKQSGFAPKQSRTISWLNSITGFKHTNNHIIRTLTLLFAHYLGEPAGREVYRRRKCSVYWLEHKLDLIRDFLTHHKCTLIMNSKTINLTPPEVDDRPAHEDNPHTPSGFQFNEELLLSLDPYLMTNEIDNHEKTPFLFDEW